MKGPVQEVRMLTVGADFAAQIQNWSTQLSWSIETLSNYFKFVMQADEQALT